MKMLDTDSVKVPVNGATLNQSIGKLVVITGTVISCKPNGTSFDIKTGDKQIVTVSLRQPLSEPVSGLIEVQGIANAKSSIICDYYLNFPKELSDTFDEDLANESIILLHNVPNPWQH